MTGDSVRPAELAEQALYAVAILLDVGIHLRVRTLEIGIRNQPRAPMSRPDHVNHVEVPLADQAVPMHIKKVEAGRGSPVPKQPRLYVVERERPFKQRIVFEVDLPDG